MRGQRVLNCATALCALWFPVMAALAENETIRNGFELSTIATGLTEPIAIEFAPDGRLLVAERGGTLRSVENGVVSEPLFPQVDIFYDNENGLLGMALD